MTGPGTPVAVVDSGGANIASLLFALERLGFRGELTGDPGVIRAARHVILPGVGAAGAAMERLRARGLDDLIRGLTQPVLGICLGLQLLFETSAEDDTRCLGLIPGGARRFVPAPGRPVPHMGWNSIHPVRESALLRDIPDQAYFYFVHSYAVDPGPATVATTTYGFEFAAVLEQGNFLATQFHPERSGAAGSLLLRNFLSRY